MELATFGATSAVGVTITVGIVKAIKSAGLPSKWLPLIGLVVGIVYGLIASVMSNFSLWEGTVWGLFITTSSSWGYDTATGFQKTNKLDKTVDQLIKGTK